jgi:hypothetical protein
MAINQTKLAAIRHYRQQQGQSRMTQVRHQAELSRLRQNSLRNQRRSQQQNRTRRH